MTLPKDVGIKHRYPRLPIGVKAKAYIQLARPFTLLAPIIGVLAGLALSVHYGYLTNPQGLLFNYFPFWHGFVTLLFVQIGSNYINQAFDAGIDQVNRPYRPIPQGLVSPNEARTIGTALWIVAVLRATTLSPEYGLLITLLVLLSYAYSAPPLRFKDRPWWGNLTIALARGLIGLPAAWTIHSPITAPEPWTLSLVLYIFMFGAITAKDYHDVEGDKNHGTHTLPVVYGTRKSMYLSLPFCLSPLVTLALAINTPWFTMPFHLYAGAVALTTMFSLKMLREYDHENPVLEGTTSWKWMYYALMGLMVLPALPGILKILETLV